MIRACTSGNYPINISTIFHGYRIIKALNNGSFSVVFLVEEEKSHQKYAAKIISKTDMINQNLLSLILNEIDILKSIDHQNIIKFHESFNIFNHFGEEFIIIITEYCKNGDLYDYIYNSGFKNEYEKKNIFYGIAKGIEYLHNKGIAHCDIKPENILLDEKFIPKLCDFGFSKKKLISSNEIKSGTFRFSAPELLVDGIVNFIKTDIWSLGITYYFLSLLDFPFNALNNEIAIHQIKNGCLTLNQTDIIHKLVSKCIKMTPDERATINEIINDEFFILL